MLTYPQIDPLAFSIGGFKVKWYGLMYLIAFLLAWGLACYRLRSRRDFCTPAQLHDGAMWVFFGGVLGGRLGYVLFYNPLFFLAHPSEILLSWNGGMSFHGGFFGGIFALLYVVWKNQRRWWQITDFAAPMIPLCLMLGRIGNFINGELWGRLASPDLPWAMVFPLAGDNLPRHPSQIYHAGLEGLALFCALWVYSGKKRPEGAVSALFLIGYGLARFVTEFFREPDHGIFDTSYTPGMGAWLSLPIILLGVLLFWAAHKKNRASIAILGAFLLGYGVFRTLVELVRQPGHELLDGASLLTMGQCLSLPMILLGVFMFWAVYHPQNSFASRICALLNPDYDREKGAKPQTL